MRPKDLRTVTLTALRSGHNLLIVGPPGCGKTDVMKAAAQEYLDKTHNGEGDIHVFHPVCDDQTTYGGLGFPSEDRTYAKMLPYGNLHLLIEAKRETIAIIDDLGQANPQVQAALMQIVQERTINGHHISDFVKFLACTNRKEDRAAVSGIITPLRGRFTIINFETNVPDWVKWANENHMPPALISYIQTHPEMLHEPPQTEKKDSSRHHANDITNSFNPRNIAEVGLWMIEGLPLSLEHEIFRGRCGDNWAADFSQYLKIYREMDDPEEYFTNPDKPLPSDPSTAFAVCSELAHRANKKNINGFYAFAMRLDAEYSTFMVFSALQRNKKLSENAGLAPWTAKYAPYLSNNA